MSKEHAQILTDLCKRGDLSEYERHFIRQLSRRSNLSKKDEKLLMEIHLRYLRSASE